MKINEGKRWLDKVERRGEKREKGEGKIGSGKDAGEEMTASK